MGLTSLISRPPCPACGARQNRFWFRKRTEHGCFDLHRCTACASGFVSPRPTSDFIESLYANYDHNGARNRCAGKGGSATLTEVLCEEEQFPNSSVDASRIASQCRRLAGGGKFL